MKPSELNPLIEWFIDLSRVCEPFSIDFAEFCKKSAQTLCDAQDTIGKLQSSLAKQAAKTTKKTIPILDLLRLLDQAARKNESSEPDEE